MAAESSILWFRQDLRLNDNRALAAALATGKPIIPVFILDDGPAGGWRRGGAGKWWLHHSLQALHAALAARGSRLVLRHGSNAQVLAQLASETGAKAIFCSRSYEPDAANAEMQVQEMAGPAGLTVHRHTGTLLVEPEAIRTKAGEPFRVFTPFWRAAQALVADRPCEQAPQKLTAPSRWPKSDKLADWRLRPTKPDWSKGLAATWQPGEIGALKRLDCFVASGLHGYGTDRDRPDIAGTSMLSPHLHFGEVSPRQCWQIVASALASQPSLAVGAQSFLRELGWREFSYHLLHHWPSLPDRSFRPEFDAFPWLRRNADTEQGFKAWCNGKTGYPIVDAGMRQLWQTGWMHNRVRMIVASFLTKHLGLHWQEGERWFWDTLVDADLASNAASWQWVAGSGADAAPYFRIFNPVVQGQKFDPEGAYVKRFVPELTNLTPDHIHAPWAAPAQVLTDAGIELGKTYPKPIVDHAKARQRALAAYAAMKAAPAHAAPTG